MERTRRLAAVPSPVGERLPDGLSARIKTLRSGSGHERAELIRDVIDAFRRLRNSIERFNQMFAGGAPEPDASPSLQPLLARLARHGDAARFARRRELRRLIRDARQLDRTRDALFSDAFSLDAGAMRQAIAELECVDAAFVALCVDHVLERHQHAAPAMPAAQHRPRPSRTGAAPAPRAADPAEATGSVARAPAA